MALTDSMDTHIKVGNLRIHPVQILRERQIGPDENLYLVKFHCEDVTSTATDDAHRKVILLWLTKNEVESNYGSFLQQMFSTSSTNENTKNENSEELQDMKEDVRRLILRLKRQLNKHSVQEDGDHGSLTTIQTINTIKVLSTYANIGMMTNEFRGSGALLIILKLLQSKSHDIRKGASEMLQALATHDSGSRAFVLLALTNEEDKFYDFETRGSLLKLFVDTCSNEEATAIPPDTMQFPQVMGRSLFKLMKLYLKVILILEETELSAPNDKEDPSRLKRAFAMGDLIYELSKVMGWRVPNLPFNNPTEQDLQIPKTSSKQRQAETEATSISNKTAIERVLRSRREQHIFGPNNSSNPINNNLLSKLIADSCVTSFKNRTNFDDDKVYGNYILSTLHKGYKVKLNGDYKKYKAGVVGICTRTGASEQLPVITLCESGDRVSVPHKLLEIIATPKAMNRNNTGGTLGQDFYEFPHKARLWERLATNLDRQSGVRYEDVNADSHQRVSEVLWLEVLFLIKRLSTQHRDSVEQIMLDDINNKLFEIAGVKLPAKKSDITLSTLAKNCPTTEYFVSFLKKAFKLNAFIQKRLCQSQKCFQISQLISHEEEEEEEEEEATVEAATSFSEMPEQPMQLVTSDPRAQYIDEDLFSLDSLVDSICSQENTDADMCEVFLVYRIVLLGSPKLTLMKLFEMESYNHLAKIELLVDFLRQLCETDIASDVESLLDILSTLPTDSDRFFCIVWLAVLIKIMEKRYQEKIELSIAASGCLPRVFEIMRKFQRDGHIAKLSIQCLNLCMRARSAAMDPSPTQHVNEASFSREDAVKIRNHITSMPDVMQSVVLPLANALSFVLNSIGEGLLTPDWTNKEWFTLEGSYYTGLCVCTVLTSENKVLSKLFYNILLPITKQGAQLSPPGSVAHQMSLRCPAVMKAYIEFGVPIYAEDKIDFVLTKTVGNKNIRPEHVTTSLPETFMQLQDESSSPYLGEPLQVVNRIAEKFNKQDIQTKNIGELLNNMLTNLTDESFDKLHTDLKQFHLLFPLNFSQDSNFSFIVECMNIFPVLLDKYYDIYHSSIFLNDDIPPVLKGLFQLLDVTSSPNFIFEREGATSENVEQVVRNIIKILHLMCTRDRDIVVLISSMDVDNILVTVSLNYEDLTADINKLNEMCTEVKQVSEMHSSVLSSIVGGSIGIALTCIEDARRRNYPLNIPLFQHLLLSLSKGSNNNHNEDDKCWEQVEVSSNSRYANKLTDGSSSTYWESNGSSGGHWIQFQLKKGIVLRKVTLFVSPSDSSYMPARIVIYGGARVGDISNELNQVSVSSSDKSVVLLEDEHRHWPYIKISIRRCQQGGIDTRVRGITMVGPQPSFWPFLHNQMQLRTRVSYHVMVQTWIAEALKHNHNDDIVNHKILLLPKRIIEFLQLEQLFANNFLPNQQSADFLGLYIKQSLATPLVKAMVSPVGGGVAAPCLFEQLLQEYLNCRNSNTTKHRVFSSRMRVLSRLLVDICNETDNIKNKRSIKHVKAESIQSKNIYNPKEDRNKSSVTVQESSNFSLLVPSSQNALDNLPILWKEILKNSMRKFIKLKLSQVSDVLNNSLCEELLAEYSRMLRSCHELFGSGPLFLNAVMFCLVSAVFALSVEDTEKFCLLMNLFIHERMQSGRQSRLDDLVKTLSGGLASDVAVIFETQYSLLLGERLNRSKFVSMDLEFNICNLLQLCFHNNHPRMMLHDIANSKTLWNRFISNRLDQEDMSCIFDQGDICVDADSDSDEPQPELNVVLMSPMLWRIPAFNKHAVINRLQLFHPMLHLSVTQYECFFRSANQHVREPEQTGESLFWTAEGHALIADITTGQEYTVSTPQMLLLLQFTMDKNKVNIEEWKKLFPRHHDSLTALQSTGLLKIQDNNVAEIKPSHHKQDMIIDLQPSAIHHIIALCGKVKEHNISKLSYIDCIITKVLKLSSCTRDELVYKVMKICRDKFYDESEKRTFLPGMAEIQCQIQHQIDSEWIYMDPERPQVLQLYNEQSVKRNYDKLEQLAQLDGVLSSPPSSNMICSLPSMPAFWQCSKSLTKDEVMEMMKQQTMTVQETLKFEESLADVLLMQYDYNETMLIEKYLDNREDVLKQAKVVQSAPDQSNVCPICLQPFTLSTTLICGHQICNDCMRLYLLQKLNDNNASDTECPNIDCFTKISPTVFQNIFNQDENYQKYEEARLRCYVECKSSLSWCHNPIGCNKIVQKGSGQTNTGLCTSCGHETCFSCTYVESHFPASCGQMSQWMEDGGFYDGMANDARSKHLARIIAKRCPNCQSNIEKDDGCLHMKCAKCHHDFCWRCLKPWRPTHKDYYKCAAKMSKLANKNSRFLEYNLKCEYHHTGKMFARSIMYRLITVHMDEVDTTKYMLILKLTMALINARKILAFSNIFNYYSEDEECLHAIHVQSVALENTAVKIQSLIEQTLTKFADLRYAIDQLSKSDCQHCASLIIAIKKQFNKLQTFSMQGLKVSELVCISNDTADKSTDKCDNKQSSLFTSEEASSEASSSDDDFDSDSEDYEEEDASVKESDATEDSSEDSLAMHWSGL